MIWITWFNLTRIFSKQIVGANRQLFQRWCMLGSLPHSISESAPWLFRTIHSTQDNDISRVPATTCNKIFCLNNLSWYSCTTSRTMSLALEIAGDYLPSLALALLIKNGSLSFEHLGWDSWRLIPPYSTPFTSCERQRSNVLRNFISFVS